MAASLPLFTWQPEFEVGIPEVDDQHRELVALLNELHVAIREYHGNTTSREVLDRLADYTSTHFRMEEELMALSRYPGLEAHRQQHAELTRQLAELRHRMEVEGTPVAFELLEFLKNWLNQHITDCDKRFGVFFQTAGHSAYAAWSREAEASRQDKKWWWRFW